ncbi:GFA family protein [Rhizobium mayense]|uniref:GFA family protein n=1 Tax=Rhizobium mayense TaxID=1312184 RepID=A0ABT7K1A1_9HYPH|nr:GFA family protein [Rhizobium mayense]MDL2402367.1 GFA family protein [Rhizobium mayense]
MNDDATAHSLTGGCQCGAIRFACDLPPQNVHVCHCRMCQKAVGGPFAVICPVMKTAFRVTRGAFSWFQSSALARRGFCRDCGTPMIFEYPEFEDIGILVGTFDQPDRAPPVAQYGNESRVSWYSRLHELPGDHPTYAVDPNGYLPRIIASNRQHPDHDTSAWPPGTGSMDRLP